MRAIVFIGPSMPAGAALPEGVETRPPAKTGDLYRACAEDVALIALVDGRFGDCRAVLHDEILHALDRGIHVWGAASLGALRAVECLPFGMRGIGRIFELYRDGAIEDDHEVALVHGPAALGSPPVSVPLVNVRLTLADGVAAGTIGAGDAAAILEAAAGIHYADLTWAGLAARLDDRRARCLDAVLAGGTRDHKREDAALLLREIGAAAAAGLGPLPTFGFRETTFWAENRRAFRAPGSDHDAREQAVLDELRLDPRRYGALAERAGRRCLDDGAPTMPHGTAPGTAPGTARAPSPDDRHWMERDMLDELMATDDYHALAHRAAAKERALAGGDAALSPPRAIDRELPGLLDWFCHARRVACDLDDADEIAASLGLADRRALHRLLDRERRFAGQDLLAGAAS